MTKIACVILIESQNAYVKCAKMHSFFKINLREEPLFAFRLPVVQNVNSYKMDKNAESAKMSHEELTTSVMWATM